MALILESQTSAISRSLLALLRPISLSKTCCRSHPSLSLAPVNTFPSILFLPPISALHDAIAAIVLQTVPLPPPPRPAPVCCRYCISALRFPYHNFGYPLLRRSRPCRYRPPSTRPSQPVRFRSSPSPAAPAPVSLYLAYTTFCLPATVPHRRC